MAIVETSKELIWLKKFLLKLYMEHEHNVLNLLNRDITCSSSCKDVVFLSMTEHHQIRYHIINELITDGILSLRKIRLTKVVIT